MIFKKSGTCQQFTQITPAFKKLIMCEKCTKTLFFGLITTANHICLKTQVKLAG